MLTAAVLYEDVLFLSFIQGLRGSLKSRDITPITTESDNQIEYLEAGYFTTRGKSGNDSQSFSFWSENLCYNLGMNLEVS
jgi:hypothetical protein